MDEKQARLQRHRLRMTLLSVVNSALQSIVIGLYAVSGATTWTTAGAFTLASLASTGLFAAGVALGWLLSMGDKRLLHAQLLANFAIQMVFMVVEPNLWMIFLGSTLITACYSMVAFTPRQFTWLWLAYGVVTGGAFWLGRHRFGTPPTTGSNLAILWLFHFLGVRRLAMTGAQFSKLREQLSEKNKELTELLARNKVLASRDELTGALNRRELLQQMAEERDRAQRTRLPFSVAIFDLDHFKSVNDEFGHAGGDAVLKRFCLLVSLFVLWLGLAALLHELFRLNSTDRSVLFVEGIATLTAIAMWFAKSERWDWEGSPGKWLGVFLVSLPISILFVEIDCAGTLHFTDGVLTCDHYGGGISIAFTIGAVATTVVALPSALRSWLMNTLAYNPGSDHRATKLGDDR